ncbi:MAG: DUF2974 domain-containing protein [Ruminococcus sp.]|nr:DUF2974 domain-containing protein [Ruminococcus sp.]
MNIIDYIKKHKDEDFKTFKLTEIDSLIFSLIPYINFNNIVSPFRGKKKTLNEVVIKLEARQIKQLGMFTSNSYKMLKTMSGTKRYGDIYLYNYMNVVNEEMQFGAITLKLNDNSLFIAYAGTDSSIIGWEEDFKMAYMYPGASQKYATIYLNKVVKILDRKVNIGGHSKGGNLAISAAMNTKFYIRKRINNIWNFDGPGFLKEQALSKDYKHIEDKIRFYVPEASIIGMLLYHQDKYTVVKAKGFSILQHDAFNWLCDDKKFIRTKLSKRSLNLEKKLTTRLEKMAINERVTLVNNLFSIFKNNNVKDTREIRIKSLFKIIKSLTNLDKETQNLLLEFILIIFIK